MRVVFFLALLLAGLILSGCVSLPNSSGIERFKALEDRYLGSRPVWALADAESQSYWSALSGLQSNLASQNPADTKTRELIGWRLHALEANRALLLADQDQALVNPTDEDCRETSYLKKAIAQTESAIDKIKSAQADGQSIEQQSGPEPDGIILDNQTTGFMLENAQADLSDLRQTEKFACLKQYP